MFTNSRSLPPKIESLVEMFDNLGLHFAAISETWMSEGKRYEKNAQKLEDRDELLIIKKSRRTRGGGVAIIFNKRKMSLKQFKIRDNKFEMVGASGRTAEDSRRLIVFSVYYPPQMKKDQVNEMNMCLSSAIDAQLVIDPDARIIICGDMNKKDVTQILTDHPDIVVLDTPETRKDERIDLCMTNIGGDISTEKFAPLISSDGHSSDHNCIVVRSKSPRIHIFRKIKFDYRPFTKSGSDAFGRELAAFDWAEIHLLGVNEAVTMMDKVLGDMYERCFPVKSKTIKSSDAPWVNNRVKRCSNKKRKYFRKVKSCRGRKERLKKIQQETDAAVFNAKKSYLHGVKKKMFETKNAGCFFRAMRLLRTKEAPVKWNVGDLFPQENDRTVADRCVEYFSAISREYEPIDEPVPPELAEQDWVIELHEISNKLKHCKKPKSMVAGDIKPELVTRYHDLLAIPLSHIYNLAIKECRWPDAWKNETVKIIPKGSVPESLKDVRNISCTPLYSKVLEGFLLARMQEDMTLSDCQFGGVKGVGIDHFLTETWHEVLMNLEDPQAAASLMSIDFSKAFNRMDHRACIGALRAKGVREHTVRMVQAFLFDRKMTVHVNGEVSKTMRAPGGSPQGSVLGSALFCATTDTLSKPTTGEESFALNGQEASMEGEGEPGEGGRETSLSPIAPPRGFDMPGWQQLEEETDSDDSIHLGGYRTARRRLLDSTIQSERASQTVIEEFLELENWRRAPPTVKAYIDDYNLIEKVRSSVALCHLTTDKNTWQVHAPGSEKTMTVVKKRSGDLGMTVNDSKTQLLCISQKGDQLRSYVRIEDGPIIKSSDQLKILGFRFGPTPDVGLNNAAIIKAFNTKLWQMRYLKGAGMSEDDLLFSYKTVVRPALDFASATYHSLLTSQQTKDLERLQLRAMKVVFGELVSYRSVIESGKIELLHDRRAEIQRKFAIKVSKMPRFQKWFPLNRNIDHNLRRREKYFIPHLRTERAKKSPIIQMRKIMNGLEE